MLLPCLIDRSRSNPTALCLSTGSSANRSAWELQSFIGTISEAADVPEGFLPHQVHNLEVNHPKLVCQKFEDGDCLLDYTNGVSDENFLEKVGLEIAGEIAREARESGRRRGSSSRIPRHN